MKMNFKLSYLMAIFNIVILFSSQAQNVAITDDSTYVAQQSAMLDVKSENKGILVPRLTSSQRLSISSPAVGLLVYDKDMQSFYYNTSGGWVNLPGVNGSPGSETDPLFFVVNNTQDTIFAVYNDGVKITLPEEAKGSIGGFAVSGRTTTKSNDEDYLRITRDSARIYVNEGAKGSIGGFAVSGRTTTGKGSLSDYLLVTSDSTRIYVTDTATKGNIGGFAVSGRTNSKEGFIKFLDLTPNNYFIGHESGLYTTGLYNSFIGYKAGMSNTSGTSNIYLGYQAGKNNSSGGHNIIIGRDAGTSNSSGTYNIFLGTGAGAYNTTTGFLTMIGINSGHFTLTGQGNTFLGCNSGMIHENGGQNTFIGTDAGRGGSDGSYNASAPASEKNTIIGYQSGYKIEGGSENVFIGSNAGQVNTSGSGNVFIGYRAGQLNTTGSNQLIIENSSNGSESALIYGEFDNDNLRLNANVGIGTAPINDYKLNVNGNVNVSDTAFATKFKGNLQGNVTGNLNDMKMGKINLESSDYIIELDGGNYSIYWDSKTNTLTIDNSSSDEAMLWWTGREGTSVVGESRMLSAGNKYDIQINDDSYGYEIHFGDAYQGSTYGTVWVQFYHGRLVGHYTYF